MAAVAEPKPSVTCAHCGGPRDVQEQRRHEKATTGTKIPAALWLTSIELDPFCSAECCRSFYGLRVDAPEADYGSCITCGKAFTKYRRGFSNYCKACGDKVRMAPRSSEPGRCAGCGCEYDTRTIGCKWCGERIRNRKRRQDPTYRRMESAQRPSRRKRDRRCGGCDCPLDEFTVGCRACQRRRRARTDKNAPDNRPVETAPPLAVSGTDGGTSVRGVTSTERRAA